MSAASIERDVADRVDPAALDDDLLGKAASAPAESDEVHVLGQLVALTDARVDVVGDDVGLDDDVRSDLDVGDSFAEGGDRAGELVSHRHRGILAGDRMRMACGWDEYRAFEVFVEVGAADAAPGDVDGDGAGQEFGLGDVLDPDVLAIVETCCSHDSSFETVESRGPADPDGTSVVCHSGSFDHSTTQ
jgi:hypothetical protein